MNETKKTTIAIGVIAGILVTLIPLYFWTNTYVEYKTVIKDKRIDAAWTGRLYYFCDFDADGTTHSIIGCWQDKGNQVVIRHYLNTDVWSIVGVW